MNDQLTSYHILAQELHVYVFQISGIIESGFLSSSSSGIHCLDGTESLEEVIDVTISLFYNFDL